MNSNSDVRVEQRKPSIVKTKGVSAESSRVHKTIDMVEFFNEHIDDSDDE